MTSSLLDTVAIKKNKVTLSDYNYQKDIENRLLMSQFSSTELAVLEEILYSSVQIPLAKLAQNLHLSVDTIRPILEKLSKTGLLQFSAETILIDKEVRKYFESQILKFDEDFVPGMDYLQNLLKKVPIHILPIWYSIPRTSNNIFESLVEKYLLTPSTFQRYLMEFTHTEPLIKRIMEEVFHSPHFEVSGKDIMKKHNLSKEQFEECLLLMEFNFLCCLGYKKVDDEWEEKITPFQEWKEFLLFLQTSEVQSIVDETAVCKKRPNDYSFAEDISSLLQKAKKQPIALEKTKEGYLVPQGKTLASLLSSFPDLSEKESLKYVDRLIAKLCLTKLADVIENKLYALDMADNFLDMKLENRALFLYRHPLNHLLQPEIPSHLCLEKPVREAEKSIVRVLNKGWVYFEDYLKGVHVPLSEECIVSLKRCGKTWKYAIPQYTADEIRLLRAILYDWLFEAGIVQVGTHNNKDCFRVTGLGQSLFGR